MLVLSRAARAFRAPAGSVLIYMTKVLPTVDGDVIYSPDGEQFYPLVSFNSRGQYGDSVCEFSDLTHQLEGVLKRVSSQVMCGKQVFEEVDCPPAVHFKPLYKPQFLLRLESGSFFCIRSLVDPSQAPEANWLLSIVNPRQETTHLDVEVSSVRDGITHVQTEIGPIEITPQAAFWNHKALQRLRVAEYRFASLGGKDLSISPL